MALKLLVPAELPKQVDQNLLNRAVKLVEDAVEGDHVGQISLAFVDEAEAKQLNRDYAGNDYATDVLSFDHSEVSTTPIAEGDVRGEVVICLPIASRQAKEHGTSLQSEVILLFVHGLLHVLGNDHAGEGQQAGFSSLQNGIMDRLTEGHRDIFA